MGLEGKTDMSVQATVHRPATDEQRRISMKRSRVSDRAADRANTAPFLGRYRVRLEPARVAGVVLTVCVLGVAPGATTAWASLFSPVSTFGSPGSGSGELQTPTGMAIQATNGAVYVADTGNTRIVKFDAKGLFIAAWGWGVTDGAAQSEVCTSNKCQAGIPGSGPGQFSRPTTIPVSAAGASANKVLVGDAGNNVVLKFDADGHFLSSIDGSTAPQGAFSNLAGVAVDQSGDLWTIDAGTANVVEFNAKGKFMRQWNDTHG